MFLTPAMQQYYDIKKEYHDCIVFFRMWDFYEMFDDDAYIAHKVLQINVTSRNKNAINPQPLAWIPYHAKDKYLPKLINAWYKVAIVEQVWDPKLKWIVKREVSRVVTPSTLSLEWEQFDDNSSNIIISIVKKDSKYGLSIIDINSNKWQTWTINNLDDLQSEIFLVSPKEVILDKNLFSNNDIKELLEKKYSLSVYYFEVKSKPKDILLNHFKTKDLKWFWIDNDELAIKSSALILSYLELNQKQALTQLSSIWVLDNKDFLILDEASIKNLDLVYNFSTNSENIWTLFWILNKTNTPMWKRKLKQNILKPLKDIKKIENRQEFIKEFIKDKILLSLVWEKLKNICDIDAILNRLALERITPKDLLNLKKSLQSIVDILEIINNSGILILLYEKNKGKSNKYKN